MFEGLKTMQGVDSTLLNSLFNNLNQLNALCSANQYQSQGQTVSGQGTLTNNFNKSDQMAHPTILHNSTMNQSAQGKQICNESLSANNNKYQTFDNRALMHQQQFFLPHSELNTVKTVKNTLEPMQSQMSAPVKGFQISNIDHSQIDQISKDRQNFEE